MGGCECLLVEGFWALDVGNDEGARSPTAEELGDALEPVLPSVLH